MNTKRIVVALGVLLLITSFWVGGDAFDIQLYDTYYVIGWSILLRGVGLLCCVIGGIYVLLNRMRFSKQSQH